MFKLESFNWFQQKYLLLSILICGLVALAWICVHIFHLYVVKSILKTHLTVRPVMATPGSLTNQQPSLKRADQSGIPAGTIHPKLGSGVSSTILQGAVVVSQRGQIEEGVDQQQQQQRQHQRQAPVVGDQNLVAASLQEGAVPRHVRHTHTRPNDASTILC